MKLQFRASDFIGVSVGMQCGRVANCPANKVWPVTVKNAPIVSGDAFKVGSADGRPGTGRRRLCERARSEANPY